MRLIYRIIGCTIFLISLAACESHSTEKKTTQTTPQGGRPQGPQKVDVVIATPQKIELGAALFDSLLDRLRGKESSQAVFRKLQ